jgi:hypothetical protein
MEARRRRINSQPWLQLMIATKARYRKGGVDAREHPLPPIAELRDEIIDRLRSALAMPGLTLLQICASLPNSIAL